MLDVCDEQTNVPTDNATSHCIVVHRLRILPGVWKIFESKFGTRNGTNEGETSGTGGLGDHETPRFAKEGANARLPLFNVRRRLSAISCPPSTVHCLWNIESGSGIVKQLAGYVLNTYEQKGRKKWPGDVRAKPRPHTCRIHFTGLSPGQGASLFNAGTIARRTFRKSSPPVSL